MSVSINDDNMNSLLEQMKFKSSLELSEFCSTMIRILCNGHLSWNLDRIINFSLFCNLLVIQMNIPHYIIYTSLKYFQLFLINNINEYDMIDLSSIAHEYSLFTVSLSLAYKFLEDNPPFMKQWSYVSMIPNEKLLVLESILLKKLNYSLSISTQILNQWITECHLIYDMYNHQLFDELNMFDLHSTLPSLGYTTLLPVLLHDDNYYDDYSQLDMYNSIDSTTCITSFNWLQEVTVPMDHLCNFTNNTPFTFII